MKFAWIDTQCREYPLSVLFEVLAVSINGYRAWKRGGTPERQRLSDAQLLTLIRTIHAKYKGAYAFVKRAGRNITLTEAGDRIYRWATEVLTHTREVERELAGLEKGEMGSAVVATSMSIGSYELPPLFVDFHRRQPDGLVLAVLGLACSSYFYHRARLLVADRHAGARRVIADIFERNQHCYGY